MMLLQRQAHPAGATRVSIDGAHVLTGGADGVVSLYPLKRWPSSQHLWARQCHDGVVTCVVLQSALGLAISCGRDGNVVMHENVFEASTSRVICRVTGEVRCVLFDAERRRVFIGGDSLRCLQMLQRSCEVHTIPMCVQHPLVGLTLSPCGNLLAMASASGAVGVLSVCATDQEQGQDQRVVDRLKNVRFTLQGLLSPTVKRDDAAAYRLCWCRSGSGVLLLLVPGMTGVRMLRFEEATMAPYTHRLHHVGAVDGLGMTDLLGVACYPLSRHMLCVVFASASGVIVAKVDDRKWSVTRLRGQNFVAVADAQVDAGTGDVVVATRDGMVTYLRSEAPKIMMEKGSIGTTSNACARRVTKQAKGSSDTGSLKVVVHDSNHHHGGDCDKEAEDEEDDDHHDGRSDNSNECGSDSSENGGSSSSVSVAQEDLQQVVHDLKRTNPNCNDDDDDDDGKEQRPSRWRQQEPGDVIRDVEEKFQKQQPRHHRSVFLDDEAEESSDASNNVDSDSSNHGGNDEDDVDDVVVGKGRVGSGNGGRAHNVRTDSVGSVVGTDVEDSSTSSQMQQHETMMHAATRTTEAVRDYSFQIGATPTGAEGSCYLAYNSVGYIHYTTDGGTTVHFHDMSLQSVRILEHGTILMGALSPVGVAFLLAQESEMDSIDDAPRLKVYYRTFVAIGTQSEWRVRLHPGEEVRCITTGIRYTAVATSRYLRIFSLSGLELAVLSLFPRIVAMVGTNSSKIMQGFKMEFDPLAICYLEHGGEMRLQVLDVGTRSVVVPATPVPLTSTHQLQWMGWSEDGPLHIADTAGLLQMFTLNWGGSWLPVFDPRCLTDQMYNLWIWGVSDEAMLAYRSCKNDPPYPAAVASGLPTERVPLFLPLTRSGTERDMVTWDHLLRREVRTDEMKRCSTFYTAAIAKHDMLHDKKIMELFSNALKEQQTTRALDLATYLELRDNIEWCAKEANTHGQLQLVQKLLLLLEVRVKAKKKRRCSLPLEGSVVSERERDLLLRKLLVKEKVSSGDRNSSHLTEPPVPVARAEGAALSAVAPPPTSAFPPSSPPCTGGDRAPTTEAGSPSRRRVSFVEQTETPPPKNTTVMESALIKHDCPPHPLFQSNSPISHRSPEALMNIRARDTPPGDRLSTSPPPPPRQAKPANPFSKSAKKTMVPLTRAGTQPLPETGSSTTFVLGDSQSSSTVIDVEDVSCSLQLPLPPPPPSSPPLKAAALSSPSKENGTSLTALSDSKTSYGKGSGGNNSTSSGFSVLSTGAVLIDKPRSATKKVFCPKAQPVGLEEAATPVTREKETAIVDPFLDLHESNAPVSLETLLVDVGHETSQTGVPRSASFGEALRKRYRDEDEDTNSDTGECGMTLPRIAL